MHLREIRLALGLAAVAPLLRCQEATAQRAGWMLDGPRGVVSPENPEATIDMYVWFDYEPGVAEGFMGAQFFVNTGTPAFYSWAHPPRLHLGEPPPQVLPLRIGRAGIYNLHIPQLGLFGVPDNPIYVFQVVWRPEEFAPRWETFRTTTDQLNVYTDWATGRGTAVEGPAEGAVQIRVVPFECEADCDTSTGFGVLDVFDFLCFQNRYVANEPYACDCDTGTGPGICDIFDFLCFQNEFVGGCP